MICEDLNVHRSINLQYLATLTMTTREDTVIHFKLWFTPLNLRPCEAI